jgi:hypothetical protein
MNLNSENPKNADKVKQSERRTNPNNQLHKNFSKSFQETTNFKFKPKSNENDEAYDTFYINNEEQEERAKSFVEEKGPRNYFIEENPFQLFNPFSKDEDKHVSLKEKKNSSLATIFSIWSCMIGSGILSLPWAVKEAGIIPTIFITIIYGVINFYTCYIYVKTGLHAKDFSDVVAEYFGKKYGFFGRTLQIIGGTLITIGALFIFFLIIK